MSKTNETKGSSTALILVIVALVIFALPFFIVEPPEDGEAFAGTDSVATEVLEDTDYEPWFEPLWEPGSGEIESGIFAMQAALGGGVLGYALGALKNRRRDNQPAHAGSVPQA